MAKVLSICPASTPLDQDTTFVLYSFVNGKTTLDFSLLKADAPASSVRGTENSIVLLISLSEASFKQTNPDLYIALVNTLALSGGKFVEVGTPEDLVLIN